jgi:hypothetical protein
MQEIDPARYSSVDLDKLVMIAVGQLSSLGIELSLENIIVASYKLFPKKFSLIGFPQQRKSRWVRDMPSNSG